MSRAAATRVILCGLALGLLSGLTGCGSSGTQTTSATTPAASIISAKKEAEEQAKIERLAKRASAEVNAKGGRAAASGATAPAAAASARGPVYIANVTTEKGDRYTVEGAFGSPDTPAQAGVDLSGCLGNPNNGRSLVVPVTYTVTLHTNVPAEVQLRSEGGALDGGHMEMLSTVSNEPCAANEGGTLSFQMQPRSIATGKTWLILEEAITPKDEHPTEASLAHEYWAIALPVERSGLRDKVSNAGTHVGCSQEDHEEVLYLFTANAEPCPKE
jgi:hypothetical protein